MFAWNRLEPSDRLFGAAALFALIVFCTTRAYLQFGTSPLIFYDSYKYLGAADSLASGAGWTPLYESGKSGDQWLSTIGGVLHVVPGYPWFIVALWSSLGSISIRGIVVAQSVLALAGYAVFSWAIGQRLGRWWGLAAFLVLTLSPPIAWLEHMVMPGSLATSCLLLGLSLPFLVPPSRDRPLKTCLGGFSSGCLLGCAMLLRGSSQAFLPLPFAVVLLGRPPRNAGLAWVGCSIAATLLVISPWIAHNRRHHDVNTLTASTGRNLYFSALWSGPLAPAVEAERLGVSVTRGKRAPFKLTAEAFLRALESGKTPVEADRSLGRIARRAYRDAEILPLLRQRSSLVYSLFALDGHSPNRSHLRKSLNSLLLLKHHQMNTQRKTEKHMGYEITRELRHSLRLPPHSKAGRSFIRGWVRTLSFEGVPLLIGFFIALLFSLRRPRDWCVLAITAGPPLVFCAAFAVVGAPLHRYQIMLHPFMLCTIVVALSKFRSRRSSSAEEFA